jgi:hypothetical protein
MYIDKNTKVSWAQIKIEQHDERKQLRRRRCCIKWIFFDSSKARSTLHAVLSGPHADEDVQTDCKIKSPLTEKNKKQRT